MYTYHVETGNCVDFCSLLEPYLDARSTHLKGSNLGQIEYSLTLFENLSESRDVKRLKFTDLQKFIEKRQEDGVGVPTINLNLRWLKALLRGQSLVSGDGANRTDSVQSRLSESTEAEDHSPSVIRRHPTSVGACGRSVSPDLAHCSNDRNATRRDPDAFLGVRILR